MVNSVELTADAYLVCLTHALSTEKEEVMGLLLGEVSKDLSTKLTMVLLNYVSSVESTQPVSAREP